MKISNIFTSLSPLYSALKISCALIFTIESQPPVISITKWNYINILIIVAVNLIFSCSYWNIEFFDSVTIQVAEKTEPFLIILDHLVCLCTIFWIFRHRHEIFRILKILNEIDEAFDANEIEIDHDVYKRWTFGIIIGCFVYTCCVSFFSSYTMGMLRTLKDVTLSSFTFWIYWLSICFQLHFTFLVDIIARRMRYGKFEN